MTEPTPPPDEPLSHQARARIRTDVLAAAQRGSQGGRGWTAPVAAAAAVVLVAGLGAWVIGRDQEDPVVYAPSETPTDPALSSSPTPSPAAPEPDSCRQIVDHQLPDARLAVQLPGDEHSSTSFWVETDRFLMCDVRDGIVGVRGPLPLDPDLDDRSTFRFMFTGSPADSRDPSIGVAGGIVPEGAIAYDVEFTFPNGRTLMAEKTNDEAGRTWWWLVHETEGDMRGPVRVTLSLSGVQRTYSVPWGWPGT